MDFEQKTASSEIRAFVRGELGRKDLERLGIEIKEIEDGYEFTNPQDIVAVVSLSRISQQSQECLHQRNQRVKGCDAKAT